MAALNYALKISDAGDKGSGPYTVVLYKNPTTNPSGGTTLATFDATTGVNVTGPGTQNIRELISQAMNYLSNDISKANQTDTNN